MVKEVRLRRYYLTAASELLFFWWENQIQHVAVIPPAAIPEESRFFSHSGQTAKSAAAETRPDQPPATARNQNRPTVQRLTRNDTHTGGAMVPNITSVAPPRTGSGMCCQNRSLPGTDPARSTSARRQNDIAAGNTSQLDHSVVLPEAEFGKVLNTAETNEFRPFASTRLSGVSCTADRTLAVRKRQSRRDIANGFQRSDHKDQHQRRSRLHSMPRP